MVSDKVQFDMNSSDLEDGNYKSYFARSMAVNSQYRENKCIATGIISNVNANGHNGQQLHPAELMMHKAHGNLSSANGKPQQPSSSTEPPEVVRLRKDLRNQNWNNGCSGSAGSSNSNSSNNSASSASSRRTSLCSNIRIQDSPVENFYLQSQVNTLQWQLKETESSREMYRAVMRQVVTFLERAHRSLELLGTRIKSNNRLSRPKSEYFISDSSDNTLIDISSSEDPWHWKKKPDVLVDDVPPEKLSQEAYRLLRTAQSLLSTHEPDLAHVTATNIEDDLGFLSQLAKEFPSQELNKLPQRATSFSLCPKLLTPEKEKEKEKEKDKLSANFNRKLSLQLNDTVRRNSFLRDINGRTIRSCESSRSSVIDTCELFSSTLIEDKVLKPFKYEKSSSPPVSSVGSAEDESGFSSMNSFQEVGIPHVIQQINKDGIDKGLRYNDDGFKHFADDIKLWETPTVLHKRWSSTPVDNIVLTEKAPVLWV